MQYFQCVKTFFFFWGGGGSTTKRKWSLVVWNQKIRSILLFRKCWYIFLPTPDNECKFCKCDAKVSRNNHLHPSISEYNTIRKNKDIGTQQSPFLSCNIVIAIIIIKIQESLSSFPIVIFLSSILSLPSLSTLCIFRIGRPHPHSWDDTSVLWRIVSGKPSLWSTNALQGFILLTEQIVCMRQKCGWSNEFTKMREERILAFHAQGFWLLFQLSFSRPCEWSSVDADTAGPATLIVFGTTIPENDSAFLEEESLLYLPCLLL